MLLRSFHTIHTQRSQASCKNECRAFRPHVAWISLIKWFGITWESTHEKPIQSRTNGQRELKVLQFKNKWWADSNKRLNRTQKGTSPSHLSYQKNVSTPFLTFLTTLSTNHRPRFPPTPSWIFTISLHQVEPLWPSTSQPPHHNRTPTPYTTNLLYPLTSSIPLF